MKRYQPDQDSLLGLQRNAVADFSHCTWSWTSMIITIMNQSYRKDLLPSALTTPPNMLLPIHEPGTNTEPPARKKLSQKPF